MTGRVARVALSDALIQFDKLYDYRLPEELAELQPGCRVILPFGAGNRARRAMIIEVFEGETDRLKPVSEAVDTLPLLTAEQLELAAWLKAQTFCCWHEALSLLYPTGLEYRRVLRYRMADGVDFSGCSPEEMRVIEALQKTDSAIESAKLAKTAETTVLVLTQMERRGWLLPEERRVRKVSDARIRMLRLSPELWESSREGGDLVLPPKTTAKQVALVKLVWENGPVAVREACYYTGAGLAVLNRVLEKGWLICYEEEAYRQAYQAAERTELDDIILNQEQQAVFNGLCAEESKNAALLFGITGSGKTMVVLKLVQKVLQEGKSALILLPEILLTPQFVRLFSGCFGERVAVLHSGLSMGVRLDEWKRIKAGEADVVIGTRSAVFAPLADIGLIAVDEEQEGAYKSELSPRYDARQVAGWLAKRHHALFLRMSATPSIATFHAAMTGKIDYYKLENRFGSATLPEVELIDMRSQQTVLPAGVLGLRLTEALAENFEKGHQSVLLLNRRGHDTVVTCFGCNTVMTCPRCSVALNYHSANGRLMCHCCGYSRPFDTGCPECGEKRMRTFGSGTQKVEAELKELLPDAKVLRMDTDTTYTKAAHDRLFEDFGGGRYDILLGTQMVAKGLDFENVTLAGVLNAEQGLFGEDYKSGERTFALLTQVVGRCGRGRFPGKAIIQTYLPEHWIFPVACNQDYETFYEGEIALRSQMLHPPFCDVCLIGVSAPSERLAAEGANHFLAMLAAAVREEYADLPVKTFGPAPAGTLKVADRYRYRLTVKCRNTARFRQMMQKLLAEFAAAMNKRDITVFADINPESYY